MKIERVHVIEAAYVGPNDLHVMFPPAEVVTADDGGKRASEWSFEELPNGDVVIAFADSRVNVTYRTRIPTGNLRSVQYAPEVLKAKKVAA